MAKQNEELALNDKIKFDSKGGSILGVLEGPVADCIHSTRNGRHYSEKLWENVFNNPLVQEQFKNGGIVGELDHPVDRDDICTEKVAVIMPEPPVKKDGKYYGKFNILDTPCGRIVHTLAKAGFRFGVSSRGTGDVDEYTDEVDPSTYEFTCFDVVLLPAVESARMKLVTEGLETNKVDYKKLLKEDIQKSSPESRKTMIETLDNLGIKLDESWEDLIRNITGDKYIDPATGKYSKTISDFIKKEPRRIDTPYEKSAKLAAKEIDKLNKAEAKFRADADAVLKNIDDYVADIVSLAKDKLKDYSKYQPMLALDLDPNVKEAIYSKIFIAKRDLIDMAKKYSGEFLHPYSSSNTKSIFTNNTSSNNNPYQLYRSEGYERALDKVIDLYKENNIETGVEMMKKLKSDLSSLNESLDDDKKCVICGKPITGYGNNAQPVKDGKCCDKCNQEVVIPARIKKMGLKEEAEDLDIDTKVEIMEPETLDDLELEKEESDKKEDCCVDDSKLIELLHKFLEKEGLELDGKGEEEQHFIELYHEVVCPNCSDTDEESVDDIDKEGVQNIEPEVEDNESDELLEQVQKLLKENCDLKGKVKALQTEKAVSGTKVNKLNEELNTFKSVAASAGKKALEMKNLETKNSSLIKENTSLKEELSKVTKKTELQDTRISKLVESKEDLTTRLSSVETENKKLKESLEAVKTNSNKKLTEAKETVNKAKKLIEKYKGLAHDTANRYIERRALALGINKNEILNRLNESYSLDDVDNVCEDLKDYSLNISRLPFAFDKPGNARVRVREDHSKDPLKDIDSEYDDTVDDYLLDLAGLKK